MSIFYRDISPKVDCLPKFDPICDSRVHMYSLTILPLTHHNTRPMSHLKVHNRVRVLTFTRFFSFRPSVHAAPPGVSTPGVHTPSLVLAHCSHTTSGVSTPRRGKNGDFEPQNAIFEPYTAVLCTYPRAPSPILARAEVLARVNTS